jgi:hypothetical protein
VDEIGYKVGAALVGTFLGILAAYGFVAPLAARMQSLGDQEILFFRAMAAGVIAMNDGASPKDVVARARRVQGRGDDSVVKLRPVIPADVQEERASDNLVVEVDAMPGGFVCSASMKGVLGPKAVKDVAAGRKGIRTLFSKEQRSFYQAHAPEGVALDDLSILGPITVFKLKIRPPELNRRIVAELWFYPDGSRILELSAKAAPAEAFQATAELRAFLAAKGLDVSGEQQTKTKTALEFFAAELSGDPAAAPG